jgi:hypothetical protein
MINVNQNLFVGIKVRRVFILKMNEMLLPFQFYLLTNFPQILKQYLKLLLNSIWHFEATQLRGINQIQFLFLSSSF